DLRLLAARSLHDLLAAQLGLPHVQFRLAPSRRLHLVAELLRGHERILEGPLALGEPARALLERGELLSEERVLLEHGLVVIGDRSSPIAIVGRRSRTGRSTGSVARWRKRTIGL